MIRHYNEAMGPTVGHCRVLRHGRRGTRGAGVAEGRASERWREKGTKNRPSNGDLLSGLGVDSAIDGVATIIHCAGSRRGDEVATPDLANAARRAGRPHVVYISVVGAERMPVNGWFDRLLFGYFDVRTRALRGRSPAVCRA